MTELNKYKLKQGFTLVELLITMVVAAILLSIAAPNFSDAMLNSRQTVKINELMSSLRLARSEAIKRATRTSVCARGPNQTCGTDWSEGFIAFIDNGDNPGVIDADEEIIRIADGLEGSAWLQNRARLVNTGEEPIQRRFIRFGPRGTSHWRGSGYFLLCDGRGQESALGINISMSGDPRRARDDNGALINSFGDPADCGTKP